MPHYSYVADLTSLVRFHSIPSFWIGSIAVRKCKPCLNRETLAVCRKDLTEEHRDVIKASRRTSTRPVCRARGPSLPSSSSLRRVPGRRRGGILNYREADPRRAGGGGGGRGRGGGGRGRGGRPD